MLHCDNIQFDTVALLLLTLTHPSRIIALQQRVVSALSSLAEIQQIQCIPYRRTGCHRKVLLSQSWLFSLYCLWVMRQVGIYTADLRFVYQINKKQEFPADRWKMKISWKPLLKCMWCAILKAHESTDTLSSRDVSFTSFLLSVEWFRQESLYLC